MKEKVPCLRVKLRAGSGEPGIQVPMNQWVEAPYPTWLISALCGIPVAKMVSGSEWPGHVEGD